MKRKHANAFLDAVKETLETTQAELFKDRDGTRGNTMGASAASIIADAAKRVKDRTDEKIRLGEKVRDMRLDSVVLSEGEDNGDNDNDSDG